MNVELPPELESFMADKRGRGQSDSASETALAGLRLLKQDDVAHTARLDAVRMDVRSGRAQLARGEGTLGVEVFQRLREKRAK